jgi:hypothetical protein
MPAISWRAYYWPRGAGWQPSPAIPVTRSGSCTAIQPIVMVIAADTADQRQWGLVIERVMDRFGRIDTVVRAEDTALRASA